MNFESIEGLTENEILNLYDLEVELITCGCACDNTASGFTEVLVNRSCSGSYYRNAASYDCDTACKNFCRRYSCSCFSTDTYYNDLNGVLCR